MKKILLILLFICSFIVYGQGNKPCWAFELFQDIANSKNENFISILSKSPSENYEAYRILVDSRQLRQDPNTLKAMANLIKKYPDYINENFSRIEKIVDNLKRNNVRCTTCSQGSNTGLPFMHVIINDIEWALTTFKNKPEVKIESVLIEMSANPQKADGGAFMLNTLKNKSSE